MTPETRYARSGDVNIAYQVVGDAPRDLVLVPGWVTNLEVFWEEPACARFLPTRRRPHVRALRGDLPAPDHRAHHAGHLNAEMDVRHVLPAIRVPTLILQSAGDRLFPAAAGRFMAEQIPGAKFVELPGSDHLAWGEDCDAIVDEIEEFLTGVRHGPEPDRVLATVLFTDIVGSTERAAALGDRR